jgi:simple sugar transport system permease protein
MKFPYKIKFESRTNDVPKWLPLATSLGAVVVAFIISGIVLWLIGGNPFRVYRYFFTASFGSWGAFSDILVKATPLIMIGLGCAVAFKMNILNIGAEGQFYADLDGPDGDSRWGALWLHPRFPQGNIQRE